MMEIRDLYTGNSERPNFSSGLDTYKYCNELQKAGFWHSKLSPLQKWADNSQVQNSKLSIVIYV